MAVAFTRVDSRSELVEILRIEGKHVLLGAEDEATKEYFRTVADSCSIGVCSQGLGSGPVAFVDALNAEAWIGYNSKVANIDVCGCSIRFVIALQWVIVSLLSQMADGSIIVINELGACRIGRTGTLLWSRSTDVVNDFSDQEGLVYLRTDETELWIDKENGELRERTS